MFCTSCGTKIESNDKFCGSCGTKINNNTIEVSETDVVKNEKTAGLFLNFVAGIFILGIVVLVLYAAFLILPWILAIVCGGLLLLFIVGMGNAVANK